MSAMCEKLESIERRTAAARGMVTDGSRTVGCSVGDIFEEGHGIAFEVLLLKLEARVGVEPVSQKVRATGEPSEDQLKQMERLVARLEGALGIKV
jgi:hypothetical protein